MRLVEKTTIDESVQILNDITEEQKHAKNREKTLSLDLGMTVTGYMQCGSNFIFKVPTELNAYRAAYRFRFEKGTTVTKETNTNKWIVAVYQS